MRNGGGSEERGHWRPKRREVRRGEKQEEKRSKKRREVRRAEKQEEKRRRELRMCDHHSDVGATKHDAVHADMTDDGEVELNLPRETVEEQIRTSEDIRKLPGAIGPDAMALDQEERHWFEPPNGARSK